MQMLLLNPGPVTLSRRVREALLRPDICHREAEFSELQNRVRDNLPGIYDLLPAEYTAVLLTGSGTAAVEAMLASIVPAEGRVLIIENGVYGERMTKMAAIHRIQHTTLHHDWRQPVDLQALENMLGEQEFTHVAVVHHETTTGRLNDLESIAAVCNKAGVPMLIDGVSSFGAEKLEFDNWNIEACAATANKCLHGVPGISFVMTRRSALTSGGPARTHYLDLRNYLQQQDVGGTPFTQSVQCLYALDEALQEYQEAGGRAARQQQYLKHMEIIREGLTANGVSPLLDAADCSCVLHAYHLPKDITYSDLHDALKSAGFIIYAGQGDLSRLLFRVSAMGAISEDDMHRFVDAVKTITGRDLPGRLS